MKRRFLEVLLILLISLSIFGFSAYLRYSNLSERNMFSVDLNFENPDPDDRLEGQQHEFDISLVKAIPAISLPQINRLENALRFGPLTSGLDGQSFNLLC